MYIGVKRKTACLSLYSELARRFSGLHVYLKAIRLYEHGFSLFSHHISVVRRKHTILGLVMFAKPHCKRH